MIYISFKKFWLLAMSGHFFIVYSLQFTFWEWCAATRFVPEQDALDNRLSKKIKDLLLSIWEGRKIALPLQKN